MKLNEINDVDNEKQQVKQIGSEYGLKVMKSSQRSYDLSKDGKRLFALVQDSDGMWYAHNLRTESKGAFGDRLKEIEPQETPVDVLKQLTASRRFQEIVQS